VGTFVVRTAPADGVTGSPLPIHAPGVPLSVAGQTVTALGAVDLDAVCVRGAGRQDAACPRGQVRVPGAFRAVRLSVCVAEDGVTTRIGDRHGSSRTLHAGTLDAPLPLGLPAGAPSGFAEARPIRRVVHPGDCEVGALVAGTQGPLVVWTPPDGAPAVAWTLDPLALPPTAAAPMPAVSPAPEGPSTGPSAHPGGRSAFSRGAADLLHDGAELLADDELLLTEGWLEHDGAGATRLHLAFESAAGMLAVEAATGEGTATWEAGTAGPGQGVGYRHGSVTVSVDETGCQVDVAGTEAGGVQGSYVCRLAGGGTASGSFIANP
jgi:hypothetical protein